MEKKTVLERFKSIKELEIADGSETSKTVEDTLPYFCKNVEEALLRLEAINNSNPSEAIKEFEALIEWNFSLAFTTNITEQNYKANIKRTLLKAQELEKENTKYKQLEEQIGCSLEVVRKALKDGIYAEDLIEENKINYYPALTLSNVNTEWYLSNHINYCVNVKEYGILFWLKKDKSE